jgi:hypothetical protein
MKMQPERFTRILKYIERKFLEAGTVHIKREGETRALIERKARRSWDLMPAGDSKTHWMRAERFVQGFYNNIVPAIRDRNEGAIDKIVACLKPTRDNCVDLLNAFEAALVIYGLDGPYFQSLYKPNESFV